jgi:hypothetical protein
MDIQNFLENIESPQKEDKEEFILDFLIVEIESDKVAYNQIMDSISVIKTIIQNDETIKSKEIFISLIKECQFKVRRLVKNIEYTMEINDLLLDKYADLSDCNQFKNKIIELYNISSDNYKLCKNLENEFSTI